MNDPYYILGIPTTATDDEVKQAYRRLAKKYHPDANPGDKTAEKKMQEINAAYDEIMRRRTEPNHGAYGSYDPYGYGTHSSSQQESGNNYCSAARNYISFGRNQEALNVLNSIPVHERTAEWYYLSAVAHSQLGNRVQALSDIRTAVNMAPGNMEYQSFLERLQNPGQTYSSRAGNYQTIQMDGFGSWCCRLCLINMVINFCCCRRC